jgi:hypothetical protein
MCKRSRIGNSGDEKIPAVKPPAQECLNLSEDELDKIIEELKQEEDKAKPFLDAIQ